MNKYFVLLIGLVIALAVFLPNLTGRIAQNSTYHLAEQLNANSDEYGEVSIERYDRGFRSSNTIVTWMPGIKQVALSAFIAEPIRLNCEGSHGVLSYSYECAGQNVEAYRNFVTTELDGVDPISIRGNISVFGDMTVGLELKQFQVDGSAGETMMVKPGNLELATDKNAEGFHFSGDFDGLIADRKDGGLAIEGLRIEGNLILNQYDIGIGSASASIDYLTLMSSKDGALQLNNLHIVGDSKEKGADLEMLYKLTAEQLLQSESPTGGSDAIDLSNLSMEIGFGGVNMAQLSALNQKWMALPSDSEPDNKAAMLALVPEIEELLKSGLSIDSRLAADYESKLLSADFNLALVGDLTFGDFLLMRINPKTFFAKIKARLKTLVPESVLDINPQAKESVANNPFYVQSGTNYESHIELMDGEIRVNGEAVSLEQLMLLLNDH